MRRWDLPRPKAKFAGQLAEGQAQGDTAEEAEQSSAASAES